MENQLTEAVLEKLLLNKDNWNELRKIDPSLIAPVLRRIVERDGCFPKQAVHNNPGGRLVFGAAITRDADGTYSIHNCSLFMHANGGAEPKRRRKSLTLEHAVNLSYLQSRFLN